MTVTLADPTVTVDGAPIGVRHDGTPIYILSGADGIVVTDDEGPDDDDEILEDDEDEDGESDGEDDDADESDDDYQPPTREQWESYQAAKRRNNQENAKYRSLKRELTKRGIDVDSDDGQEKLAEVLNQLQFGGDGKKSPDEKSTERAIARAAARAAAQAEATYKPLLVDAAVQTALATAGWSGTDVQRAKLFGKLEMDDFDLADGKITGADDLVEEWKVDFPEFFQAKKSAPARRSGAADVDGGNRRGKATEQPKNWLAKIDAGFGN